jgi:hypothetical protein
MVNLLLTNNFNNIDQEQVIDLDPKIDVNSHVEGSRLFAKIEKVDESTNLINSLL